MGFADAPGCTLSRADRRSRRRHRRADGVPHQRGVSRVHRRLPSGRHAALTCTAVRAAPVAILACLALGAGLSSAAATASPAAVRIAAVGDMAMVASSDGGSGFFSAAVRRELTGDVVLGNLEGTLTTASYSKCGAGSSNCFAFHAPPTYAEVLRRAGFSILNLANNHANDYGPQ